jgi:hypothetical protein
MKRHMKIGVNAQKLGIMKDRETLTDPRLVKESNTT